VSELGKAHRIPAIAEVAVNGMRERAPLACEGLNALAGYRPNSRVNRWTMV